MKYTKKRYNKKRISKKNKQYGGTPIKVERINRYGKRFDRLYNGPEELYFRTIDGKIFDFRTKDEIGIWNSETNQIDFFENYKNQIIKDNPEISEQIQNIGPLNCDNCIICNESFFNLGINTLNLYIHTCKNMFHTECLKSWCKDKPDCPCPICRNEITYLV